MLALCAGFSYRGSGYAVPQLPVFKVPRIFMAKFRHLLPTVLFVSAGCFNQQKFVVLDCKLETSVADLKKMIDRTTDGYHHTARIDTLYEYYRQEGVFDRMNLLHAQQEELIRSMRMYCPDNLTGYWVLRDLQHEELRKRIRSISRSPGQNRHPIIYENQPPEKFRRIR